MPATRSRASTSRRLTRIDTGGASHIVFVVRDDAGQSDLLFQTSDTTWQAYNQYGGNSLYVGDPPAGRAYKVSYNRPFTTRGHGARGLGVQRRVPDGPLARSRTATTSATSPASTPTAAAPSSCEHKIFLSVGHDEYWSGAQRTNVEAARAAGVHLAFFSGNEVFWKTRWENSISTPATRLSHAGQLQGDARQREDRSDRGVWTGTWRDPRFSPPADGGRPENALTGTIFTVNCGHDGDSRSPQPKARCASGATRRSPTSAPGASPTLPDGTLGYEWDEDLDNGFRPAGPVRLSDTTVSGVEYLQDYGSTYASGTANHALTLYRHASGALVFGAGTVQWSWGLDGNHDRGSVDRRAWRCSRRRSTCSPTWACSR